MTRLAHVFKGSTRIGRGWYDPDTKTVEIEFRDAAHVLYREVPREVWDGLVRSKSAGRYLSRVLERYPYRRR